MFRFANPDILYALVLIPALWLFFLANRKNRKRKLNEFGDPELMKDLMPDVSQSRPVWKYNLLLFSLFVLIFVLARPQFGSKLQTVKRKGVEIVIALDVSNSMLAQDIKPNRLESAKQAISRLLDKLHDDKIGLIVFAGDAYTQLPVTTDYVSAKMFLSTINTNSVPVQGTAIGKAIELGIKSFGPENGAGRAIIVITDGENHEDNAVAAAREARESGIVVYTIGMGLAQGAPIPIPGTNDFRKDREGNVVVSKLDWNMLKEIASAGGGNSYRATNGNVGLNNLYDDINKLDKAEMESRVYSDYEEQFDWLAWIVLAVLFFEIFILERKNRLFSGINLFKEDTRRKT
ncbi:VWA domain-containing protein [Saccharicrinis sp. FJH54]|uniref:vWA domain-containing protein n=1 Tax=Saccharicrinis sp. FJH54 TaxID=3344665 RepID=UPI0035D4111D